MIVVEDKPQHLENEHLSLIRQSLQQLLVLLQQKEGRGLQQERMGEEQEARVHTCKEG